MPQIQIKDATGAIQTAAKVDNTGQTTRTNSFPVTIQSEDMKTLAPGATGTVTTTTNTTAVTGNFSAIQVLEDAVFQVFTETGAAGQGMTGFTVIAGTTLFGQITAYTLTSGKVRAYSA